MKVKPARSGAKTKLYLVWVEMRARCNNPKHVKVKNYGARGITVCSDWGTFVTFKNWAERNGYIEGLTIDRINVHGNYEPDNCRWTDMETQNWNRTDNILWVLNGKEYNTKQISRKFKIPASNLRERRARGWSTEKIVSTPVVKSKQGSLYYYKGRELTLSQWAVELGIKIATLSKRLNKRGWTVEEAFSTPVSM